jgi:hypothetical protein
MDDVFAIGEVPAVTSFALIQESVELVVGDGSGCVRQLAIKFAFAPFP